MATFDFVDVNPQLMREKARAAEFAGDDEKAALYAAVAELTEINEAQSEQLDDCRKYESDTADYPAYKQFFDDCFDQLTGHYPCPSVTSGYDCSVIFDAIQKGEENALGYVKFFEKCVEIVAPGIDGYDVASFADRGEIYRALRKGVQNV